MSYNLTQPISWVLIRQHLIFCSLTSPACCNLPRKCTRQVEKRRQKAEFFICHIDNLKGTQSWEILFCDINHFFSRNYNFSNLKQICVFLKMLIIFISRVNRLKTLSSKYICQIWHIYVKCICQGYIYIYTYIYMSLFHTLSAVMLDNMLISLVLF